MQTAKVHISMSYCSTIEAKLSNAWLRMNHRKGSMLALAIHGCDRLSAADPNFSSAADRSFQQLVVVTTPIKPLTTWPWSGSSVPASEWRSIDQPVPVVASAEQESPGVFGFDGVSSEGPHKTRGRRQARGDFFRSTVFGFAPRASMIGSIALYLSSTP